MELALIFVTALLVAFSGAMMPGPLLTVTISESVRRGFWAGPMLVLGHGLLELVLVVALVLGIASILVHPTVSTTIFLMGGGILCLMGLGMARDAWRGTLELDLAANNQEQIVNSVGPGQLSTSAWIYGRGLHPVAAGILVSLANPYWLLWWATVGLGYVTIAMGRGLPGVASFFTGHILADLIWYSLVSGAVAGGRRFMSQVAYRVLIGACGVFLVGLGGYFIYSGLARV